MMKYIIHEQLITMFSILDNDMFLPLSMIEKKKTQTNMKQKEIRRSKAKYIIE